HLKLHNIMMKKLFVLLPFLLFFHVSTEMKAQTKAKKKTVKSTSPKPTEADLEVQKFRNENPQLTKSHMMGHSTSYSDSGIDYSNFNGKNCTEIAKKENWGNWNPPVDADKRCEKFLKMK